jgi:hypothetical protein
MIKKFFTDAHRAMFKEGRAEGKPRARARH